MIEFLATVGLAHNLFSKAQNHRAVLQKKNEGIQLVHKGNHPIYM